MIGLDVLNDTSNKAKLSLKLGDDASHADIAFKSLIGVVIDNALSDDERLGNRLPSHQIV